LPSCEHCNRVRGKMNHFPVKGKYVSDPQQDLASEDPLLLNPYNRNINPFEHLEFNAIGMVTPYNVSEYGDKSKEYYHLNRSGLPEARRKAIADVHQDWSVTAIRLSDIVTAYQNLRDDIAIGGREYSAAQWWEFQRITKRLDDAFNQNDTRFVGAIPA
jgi:hypothetical protein